MSNSLAVSVFASCDVMRKANEKVAELEPQLGYPTAAKSLIATAVAWVVE